jgi:hypothetical protein
MYVLIISVLLRWRRTSIFIIYMFGFSSPSNGIRENYQGRNNPFFKIIQIIQINYDGCGIGPNQNNYGKIFD